MNNDYRTEFEKGLYGIVMEFKELLAEPHPTRTSFQGVMGHLRDVEVYLLNRQYGCKTGKHASACLCKDGLEHGENYYSTKKWRKATHDRAR